MASTANVVVTTLNESESHIFLHVFVTSDGSIGELQNVIILDPTPQYSTLGIDPSQYAKGGYQDSIDQYINPPTQVLLSYSKPILPVIRQVWHSASWFDFVLGFNAVNPVNVWVAARDTNGYSDFRHFGGLKDRANPDPDGRIVLSTVGLDSTPGMFGSLVLDIKKN